MESISIGADFDAVNAASNKLIAQLQRVDSHIATVGSTIAKFNKEGVHTQTIVKGLTNTNQEYTAVLKAQVGANGELLSQYIAAPPAISRLTIAQNDAKAALQKLNQEKRTAAQLTRTLREAERESAKAAKTQQQALRNAERERIKGLKSQEQATSTLHSAVLRLGRSAQYFATYKAFSFLSKEMSEAVVAASNLQKQLSLIRTISQDNQQTFGQFGKQVRDVSDRSGFSSVDVAKGFYNTTSNQIAKGASVGPFVEEAAKLAKVTGSDLPNSVNLLSSVLNAYSISAEDADVVSAQLFRTIDEGRVVASELANTFGRVLVLGKGLGVSVEDLESTLAITTQKGFKTTDALTLLTNILIKLEKPTEATAAFFATLGVDSGEAAIQLYGFTGVLEKMIKAVNSGQVNVSAFFDEIRGRKQFAVFEQSIGQIKRFSNALKDVAKTTQLYDNAYKITQESPADYLSREANKLNNLFIAEVGDKFLKVSADIVKYIGGVTSVADVNTKAGLTFDIVTKGALTYAAAQLLIIGRNFILSTSFKTLGVSVATAALPLLAATAAYASLSQILATKLSYNVDASQLDVLVQRLKDINKLQSGLSDRKVKYTGFKDQAEAANNAYRKLIGVLAQATLANNSLIDNIKVRSQDTAESVKVNFGGYIDTIKEKVSETKKEIGEIDTELKHIAKSALGYRDSLDSIIHSTRLNYASENYQGNNQKIEETTRRIGTLKKRVSELYGQNTQEARNEARKLFDELAKLTDSRFRLGVEARKKQLEASGTGGTLLVNTKGLEQELAQLAAQRAKFEAQTVNSLKQQQEIKKAQLATDEKDAKTLGGVLKQLEKISAVDSKGKVSPQYKDSFGKFDRSKFDKSTGNVLKDIDASTKNDMNARIALTKLYFDRLRDLREEAYTAETRDVLSAAQVKASTEENAHVTKLKNIEEERKKANTLQDAGLNKLKQQGAYAEQLFNKVNTQQNVVDTYYNQPKNVKQTTDTARATAIDLKSKYDQAINSAVSNATEGPDGRRVLRPQDIDEIAAAYDRLIDAIVKFNNLQPTTSPYGETAFKAEQKLFGVGPAALNVGGVGYGAVKDDNQQTIKQLKTAATGLAATYQQEGLAKDQFNQNVVQPIIELRQKFPDLAKAADDATISMAGSFNNLASEGLDPLIKRLEEIERKTKALKLLMPNEKQSSIIGEDGNVTYAATGGVVGLFPGQPRGADRYPIWAAAGERIIDAKSYSLFKPQIEAILTKRQPQYMAEGGVVGGDTNIGDINISVSGKQTTDSAVREIGQKLRREIRRGNIKLN